MKKYLTEFIGTFFLVLIIVLAVNGGAGALAPIAIGLMLMALVYAGGHISGAHYNPAVTLAVWMRGKCTTADVLPYMVSQIAGAAVAALVAGAILGGLGTMQGAPITVTPSDFSKALVPGLLAEFLGTFALCYVILNVATAKNTEGNSFYGLAIGLTVTACAYTLGGITGGAFNPAVAVGVSVAKMSAWSNIWVFLVGNFAAAALAATVFRFTNGND